MTQEEMFDLRLTDEQLEEQQKKLAFLVERIDALKEERKRIAGEFMAEIKELEEKAHDVARALNRHYERAFLARPRGDGLRVTFAEGVNTEEEDVS